MRIKESRLRRIIRKILSEEINQDVDRYEKQFGGQINVNTHGFHGAGMENQQMRFGEPIPGPQFNKKGPVTDGEIRHALNYLNKYKPDELVVYSRGSAVWAAAQDKAGTDDDYKDLPDNLKKITFLAPAAKRPDWGQQGNALDALGSADEVIASTSDGRVPLAQAAQVAKEVGGNMKIYKPAWMAKYDLKSDPDKYGRKGHTTPLRFDPTGEKIKDLTSGEIDKIIDTFPDWGGSPAASAEDIKKQEEMAQDLLEIRKYVRTILFEKKKKPKKKKRVVKCPLLPNGKRDYKCEYQKYGGASKKGKKDRAARNKARKQAERMGLVKKGDGMELDHIMPLSLGGANDQTNWQIMSRTDNRRKGSKWDGKSGSRIKESRSKRKGRNGFKIKDDMGTELKVPAKYSKVPPEFEHPQGLSGVIKRKEIKPHKGIMYYKLNIGGKTFEGEISGYGYASRGIDDFGPFSMRLKQEHRNIPMPMHEPQIVFAWVMGDLRIFDV